MDTMDTLGILREAALSAAKHNNMGILDMALEVLEQYRRFFIGSTIVEGAQRAQGTHATSCACGDNRGIADMCDDCFNVGCRPQKPCFWTEEDH